MSEPYCKKSVTKHYGERESGAYLYVIPVGTFVLRG